MHALSACYVKALKWASNTWSPASEVSPQTQRTEKAIICWIFIYNWEENLANCFSTRAVDFGHLLHSQFARAVEKHNIEHVLVITGTNVTVQSSSKVIVLH